MGDDLLLAVFLPAALAVIMLGLGLSLTPADFRRVLAYPKAIAVALACQVLALPLVCLGLAHAFGLSPALAVGLMLLAASPGGPSANLYSHLADGDVALNITLTAVNSALSIVTLPLVVNLSLAHFFGDGKAVPLQFAKVVQVFFVVLGPVALGMALRRKYPGLADRCARPVKLLSVLFLFAVIVLACRQEFDTLRAWVPVVGLAALSFNLLSLAVGYGVPRLLALSRRQSIAISMEIGMHNGTLAITVALSPTLLNDRMMAIPAAVYGLFAFVTAAAFGAWLNRGRAAVAGAAVRE
jgi:bile acid:Na+ symporter, BASS family